MKTVSDHFKRMIEANDSYVTTYLLEDPDGTMYDITPKVVTQGTIDERAEDEELNVGGGDLQLVLDNRDRYFVGDHELNGLFDYFQDRGNWRLRVLCSLRHASDEPVTWFGVVSQNYERIDNGYRIVIDIYSPSSYAKQVSAWDGDESQRFIFNTPISQLLATMADRVDTHGDMTTDIELPTLQGSAKHFQVFDSLIDDEDTRRRGPRGTWWLKTDGDNEIFWVNTNRPSKSFILTWSRVTKAPVSVASRPFYLARATKVIPADSLGTSGARRFWVCDYGGNDIALIDPNHATTLLVNRETVTGISGKWDVTPVAIGTAGIAYFTTSTLVIAPNQGKVGWRGIVYSMTVGGTLTAVLKWFYGPNSGDTPAGYTYIGEAGRDTDVLTQAVVHSNGNLLGVVSDGSRSTVYNLTTTTSVHKTLNGDPVPWGVEGAGHGENYVNRGDYIEYSGTENWWGVIADRRGAGGISQALLWDLGATHPDKLVRANGETRNGLTPGDGIGLLYAGHPDNPTGEDEKIRTWEETRLDPDVSSSSLSQLWSDDRYGFGVRSYTVQDIDYFPTVVEDYYTALVTTDIDVNKTRPFAMGERLDGVGSLPAEFYLFAVGHGPSTEPVEESRRISLLVRQDTTTPLIYRMELRSRKAWDAITQAAQASNVNVVFRWDDGSGVPVMVVRPRGSPGTITDEEYAYIETNAVRQWEHRYDGITITTGLRQEFNAGDTTSPNVAVLEITGDWISPSFGGALAAYDLSVFDVQRRAFRIRLMNRPHWEVLDTIRVYLVNDDRDWAAKIIARRIDLARHTMTLLAVEQ